jgi:hypothetical protein
MMLKKFRFLMVLIASVGLIIVTSCNGDRCEDDIELGSFELAEETRNFIPYDGVEPIIFRDHTGRTIGLSSRSGISQFEYQLITRVLCTGDFEKVTADDQEEYYRAVSFEVLYQSQDGRTSVYVDALTLGEDNATGEEVFYDLFRAEVVVDATYSAGLEVVTANREGRPAAEYLSSVHNLGRFVGDTILYGRQFRDVYGSLEREGTRVFYNATEGVVAIELPAGQYLVKERSN